MKKLKSFIIALLFAVLGIVLNLYVQPMLNGTAISWLPLAYLFIVPFCYYLSAGFGFYNKKSILYITAGTLLYIVISNFIEPGAIWGKVIAALCGALGLYLAFMVTKKK